MYFVLTYNTVSRFNDRKMRYRSDHLKWVKHYYAEGKLKMGGALLEPNDAALLIFKCNDIKEVEDFVEAEEHEDGVRHTAARGACWGSPASCGHA